MRVCQLKPVRPMLEKGNVKPRMKTWKRNATCLVDFVVRDRNFNQQTETGPKYPSLQRPYKDRFPQQNSLPFSPVLSGKIPIPIKIPHDINALAGRNLTFDLRQ